MVTGSSGRFGSRFTQLYQGENPLLAPNRHEFDVCNRRQVSRYLTNQTPWAIVHLAAYTDVGKAEDEERELCYQVNETGTRNIVDAARQVGAHVFHCSTQMVFAGDSGPYSESDPPETNPNNLTVYGHSKALAEGLVRSLGDLATIFRISYPYFLATLLTRLRAGDTLRAFTDQQISITDVDRACLDLQIIIARRLSGTFHLTSSEPTTPYDLLTHVLNSRPEISGKITPSSINAPGVDRKRYPPHGDLSTHATLKALGTQPYSPLDVADKLLIQLSNHK